MPGPEKRDSRGLSARRFGAPTRSSPRRRFEGIGVRWRVKSASLGLKAHGNEGDLRAELSIGNLGRPAAVRFPAAAISMSTMARCSDAAREVTTGGEGASGLSVGAERSGALVGRKDKGARDQLRIKRRNAGTLRPGTRPPVAGRPPSCVTRLDPQAYLKERKLTTMQTKEADETSVAVMIYQAK